MKKTKNSPLSILGVLILTGTLFGFNAFASQLFTGQSIDGSPNFLESDFHTFCSSVNGNKNAYSLSVSLSNDYYAGSDNHYFLAHKNYDQFGTEVKYENFSVANGKLTIHGLRPLLSGQTAQPYRFVIQTPAGYRNLITGAPIMQCGSEDNNISTRVIEIEINPPWEVEEPGQRSYEDNDHPPTESPQARQERLERQRFEREVVDSNPVMEYVLEAGLAAKRNSLLQHIVQADDQAPEPLAVRTFTYARDLPNKGPAKGDTLSVFVGQSIEGFVVSLAPSQAHQLASYAVARHKSSPNLTVIQMHFIYPTGKEHVQVIVEEDHGNGQTARVHTIYDISHAIPGPSGERTLNINDPAAWVVGSYHTVFHVSQVDESPAEQSFVYNSPMSGPGGRSLDHYVDMSFKSRATETPLAEVSINQVYDDQAQCKIIFRVKFENYSGNPSIHLVVRGFTRTGGGIPVTRGGIAGSSFSKRFDLDCEDLSYFPTNGTSQAVSLELKEKGQVIARSAESTFIARGIPLINQAPNVQRNQPYRRSIHSAVLMMRGGQDVCNLKLSPTGVIEDPQVFEFLTNLGTLNGGIPLCSDSSSN